MDPTNISFLDGLRNRTPASWECLERLYGPWLRHWLVQRLEFQQPDAEDMIQDVLLGVHQEFPADFSHNGRTGAFRKWLREFTHHRLLRYWRDRRTLSERVPQGEERLAQLADSSSELSRLWDREHDDWIIRRGWQLLSPRFDERTLAVVRRLLEVEQRPRDQQQSPAEVVAREFHLSRSSVHSYKSRVIKELRQIVAQLVES